MIKLIIFDFDGTIVDSKAVYYSSIKKHLIPLGFGEKKIDNAINLGLNLDRTLKKFISSWFYRYVVRRKIMKDVLKEANDIEKCKNILHTRNIHIKKILISNSLSELVISVLKHLKLNKLFKEIYCADNFDDKAKFLKTYLKINKIQPNECFYVGDRVADIKLTRKIGGISVIVSGKCSWNPKDELIRAKPDFIIPDLADLKRIAERFKG